MTTSSPTICARMSPAVAPLARRRPISRVRCVTVCHSTPVSPIATIRRRNPAITPAPISGPSTIVKRVSRIWASGLTSKDHSGRDRLQALDEPLLEGRRRPRAKAHEQVVGRPPLDVVQPVPLEEVVLGRRELAVLAEVA